MTTPSTSFEPTQFALKSPDPNQKYAILFQKSPPNKSSPTNSMKQPNESGERSENPSTPSVVKLFSKAFDARTEQQEILITLRDDSGNYYTTLRTSLPAVRGVMTISTLIPSGPTSKDTSNYAPDASLATSAGMSRYNWGENT